MDKGQDIKSGLFQVAGWHGGLHNNSPLPPLLKHTHILSARNITLQGKKHLEMGS